MGSNLQVVEDLMGILTVYSDGTISRSNDLPFNFPVQDDGSVVWKDCVYDKDHDLNLRMYKPVSETNSSSKLPIVLYIHGGGFCLGSRTLPLEHGFCLRLSSVLQAFVIAPDYRLAPEHRLPAAIDDVLSSVKWLQTQAKSKGHDEEWLSDRVEFGKVFVVGDSSGGNIAHHLAVRLESGSLGLAPVQVRGYVLMSPFFGGTTRTNSEKRMPEMLLNMDIVDRFWRLSLPVGETTDHPLANPFGPGSPSLKPLKLDPVLVIVGGGELLKDRVKDYASKLKEFGKKIEYSEFEGKQHGFFLYDPYSKVTDGVLEVIKTFMTENSK